MPYTAEPNVAVGEGKMKMLTNLALLLVVAFLAFTQQGQGIAGDLFALAHGYLTDHLARIFESSLR